LLGEIAAAGGPARVVLADMEAGLGTLSRLEAGQADMILVVAEPTPKALEVARRTVELARERAAGPVVVVANRIRHAGDLALVRATLPEAEVLVVPDDRAIEDADREARAPIDAAPGAPGVLALTVIAERLLRPAAPAAER
jgi:CO dehydrogenase maturation factor